MHIIRPDIYEQTTLRQTTEKLSDKNIEITDDLVINLVTKYFFAYFYPEAFDRIVHSRAIEDLFQKCALYFAQQSLADKLHQTIDHHTLIPEAQILAKNNYAIGMLGDIAPTVALVKDIVSRKLEATLTDRNYNGLDLGAGSGILLLAEYIQARRNDFKSIQCIGIEKHGPASAQTNKLLDKLYPGYIKLMTEDTTKIGAYRNLHMQGPINFVTNETIPSTGQPMGNNVSDPFYENITALYDALQDQLPSQTQFFPQKMQIDIRINGSQSQEVSHANKRYIHELLQLQELLDQRDKTIANLHVFQHIYPLQIQVNNSMIPMHQVGNNLLETGKVNKHPVRKQRR